ncbi:MAG: alpha/beta hydrolase, partial [Gammaproteobacteria bacterium]|nr:alpha/beta hydrolase [Gammaproteobacteria bacterium]
GVAHWKACMNRESELAENVEVRASHTGMAMNPDVLHVIADRLAQDPGDWRRFSRTQGCRPWIYPEPSRV